MGWCPASRQGCDRWSSPREHHRDTATEANPDTFTADKPLATHQESFTVGGAVGGRHTIETKTHPQTTPSPETHKKPTTALCVLKTRQPTTSNIMRIKQTNTAPKSFCHWSTCLLTCTFVKRKTDWQTDSRGVWHSKNIQLSQLKKRNLSSSIGWQHHNWHLVILACQVRKNTTLNAAVRSAEWWNYKPSAKNKIKW